MKKLPARKQRKHSTTRPLSAGKLLLPTLAAAGGLVAGPAAALELGEFDIHSTLGQPLRASIAYALGPNEQIGDYCISLQGSPAANGLPTVSQARIRVGSRVISILGSSPIREPIITTRVVVKCPHTPRLSREYTIFVDPAGAVADALNENPQTPKEPSLPRAPAAPALATVVATTPQRTVDKTPIQGNSRHQVRPGESLSEIAERLENRQTKLWDAIYTIFYANPDAFIDSDPNKLKAGTWLVIPDNAIFGDAAVETPVINEYVDARPEPKVVEPPVINAYVKSRPETAVIEPAVIETPVASQQHAAVDTQAKTEPRPVAIEPPQATDFTQDYSTLRPGDIVLDDNDSFVAPESSARPESKTTPENGAGDTLVSDLPEIPATGTAASAGTASGWSTWLIAGGVALFAGLSLIGRRLRERFGSKPIGIALERPSLVDTDFEVPDGPAIGDVDYDIADNSPTHENLALDADLIVGTGLDGRADVDINQDFGFAVTTHLDMELPERAALGDEPPSTDILPPLRSEIQSILESEVLPEDDDYDMSVIVDATKIRNVEDVTSRDLMAIAVDNEDEDLMDIDSFTVSQEADYDVVEEEFDGVEDSIERQLSATQEADYDIVEVDIDSAEDSIEKQLSATQVLSDEIEKAAAAIADSLDKQEPEADNEPGSDESTAAQFVNVSELDVTVNLPAENDVISDLEDTAINEALTFNTPMDDNTVAMPSADDELTVEMPDAGIIKKKAG